MWTIADQWHVGCLLLRQVADSISLISSTAEDGVVFPKGRLVSLIVPHHVYAERQGVKGLLL